MFPVGKKIEPKRGLPSFNSMTDFTQVDSTEFEFLEKEKVVTSMR